PLNLIRRPSNQYTHQRSAGNIRRTTAPIGSHSERGPLHRANAHHLLDYGNHESDSNSSFCPERSGSWSGSRPETRGPGTSSMKRPVATLVVCWRGFVNHYLSVLC